jgi:hypothetical protein
MCGSGWTSARNSTSPMCWITMRRRGWPPTCWPTLAGLAASGSTGSTLAPMSCWPRDLRYRPAQTPLHLVALADRPRQHPPMARRAQLHPATIRPARPRHRRPHPHRDPRPGHTGHSARGRRHPPTPELRPAHPASQPPPRLVSGRRATRLPARALGATSNRDTRHHRTRTPPAQNRHRHPGRAH